MNYNKKDGKREQQKLGISPAIATVILIAITLVAGVAIGGFVFGLFGSQTTTAQVTSTAASIPVSYVNGTYPVGVQDQRCSQIAALLRAI